VASLGERLFGWLIRLYPREFRDQYREDLLAFYGADRGHAKYGTGLLRPVRFWSATTRDVARAAWNQRRTARRLRRAAHGPAASSAGRLRQDLRFAWRGVWASRGVTAAALMVLTLGVGAGTAVFSVVDAVALRGLPFDEDHRLVSVAEADLQSGRPTTVAPQNYFEWRTRQDAFETLGALAGGSSFVARDEPVEPLRMLRVTASLLEVLRVRPARGRPLAAADERPGARPVAIISDRLWRRRFNADPAVVGRPLASKTQEYEIVGVMPPGFTYPISSLAIAPVDFWVPFIPTDAMHVRGTSRTYMLSVIARLRPGVSVNEAATRMTRLRDAMAAQHPAWFHDRGVLVRPLRDSIVAASVRSWMLLLLLAVGVVVLMACLNSANLLVARALVRGPELAVRMALGASRWDLARALLVENALLALIGTAAGVLAAVWGVEILRSALPAGVPRLSAVALDFRVLAIAAGAAVLSSMVFGTIPALQASRPDVITLLGHTARTHSGGQASLRLRTGLVVAEVALSVVLLAGAALFLTSFRRVTSIDLGFDPRHVVAFLGSVMDSRGMKPATTPDARAAAESGQVLVADAVARLRAIPGVVAVAPMQGGRPLSGSGLTVAVQHADRLTPPFEGDDEAWVRSVGAGYLDVLRGTMQSGRWIAETDVTGTNPVVVLNSEAARRYFGSRDPVGQRLLLDDFERTVVGVVRSMRWRGPESEITPEAFVPFFQTSHPTAEIVVRTDRDPAALVPRLQEAIRQAIPTVSAPAPTSLERSYAGLLEYRRFNMILLMIFGAVALGISAIGVYGLMAFLVARRRREIGVRVALGAAPAGILTMVIGRAARLLVAGLVPGIIAALFFEQTARAFLFDARPHDPAVYLGAGAVLLVAGLLAAIGPARRATRMDPLAALRQD
jgi:putative ABC transport system permease protein